MLSSEIPLGQAHSHKKAIKKNKNTPCVDFQEYSFRYFWGIDLFAKNRLKEAITAKTNKLAVIIYNMLTKFEPTKPYQKKQNEKVERLKN